MPKFRRILSKIHLALSLIPWATLAFFTLYAFLVLPALGRGCKCLSRPPAMPGFYYKQLDVLEQATDDVHVLLLALMAMWLLLLVVRFATGGRLHVWRAVTIFMLGWVALLWVMMADPVYFVRWRWG